MTALVACLIIAPAASASGWTVLKAPWTGSTVTPTHSINSGPCAHAAITTLPQWYGMTGIARTSMWAAASQCGTTSSPSAYSAGAMTLTVPISLTSGSYRVLVNWKAVALLTASYTIPTACPSANGSTSNSSACTADAEAFLEVISYVEDTTNNSYVSGTPSYIYESVFAYNYNYTYCSAGNCTHYQYNSSSPTVSLYLNKTETSVFRSTFVGTHSYELVTYLAVETYAAVSGYPSSHASASANLATHGHHALLASIILT